MFKIFVNETTISSGTVKISWCLSEDTIQHLYSIRNYYSLGGDDLYVVVIVTNGKAIEYRSAFPLKDLIGYLPLRVSGENKISAFITCKSFAKKCLNKGYYGYDFGIVDYDGNILKSMDYDIFNKLSSSYACTTSPIIIDVPKECFAKEPSEFEKNWVNWLFSSKSKDQCSFRRRRLFAYTIQPIIFLFKELLLSMLLLVSLFFGLRSSKEVFNYLINPLSFSFCENFELSDLTYEGSVFVSDKDHKVNYLRLVVAPFIIPPIVLFLFWYTKYYSLIKLLEVLFLACVMTFSYLLTLSLIMRVEDKQEELEKDFLDSQTLKLIVCDGSVKPTNLSELPKEKRTIKLRFLDLKSKVCKPFSL